MEVRHDRTGGIRSGFDGRRARVARDGGGRGARRPGRGCDDRAVRCRGRGAAREVRVQQVRRGGEGAAPARVPPPVQGPDADRAAGGGHRQHVPARPVRDGRGPRLPDPAQRVPGPQPGGQGRGERRRPPEDDDRPGQGPTRWRGPPDPDGGAGPGRHRQHRGGRPRPGRRPDHPGGDPRDRRIRPHRRERARAQEHRCGQGRRGPRRPDRHGVHEHPGHPRRCHVRRHLDRHGDRGRPHLQHAPADDGRGHAAHQAAQHADQPDPRHRRDRAGHLDRPGAVSRPAVPAPVPDRRRVLGLGHPHRPAGRRHDDPRQRHRDARQGGRDREAPALGGDARLDLGDQLRQDRHPHAQPDDRRADGDRRPAVHDHRRGLLDGRQHPGRGRARGRAAGALPAADGAVRRRGREGRGSWSATHRGRARGARGQGRRRPGAHAREVPADRRGPVRRRVQVHGDVPRDAGRVREAGRPGVRQGRPGPAPRPGRQRHPPRRRHGTDRGRPRPVPGRERPARVAGPARHGHGLSRLRPGDVRPHRGRPPAACQGPDAAGPRRHRRPAAPRGARRDRDRARGGHRGPDDHRRPCRHGRGDRPPAGDHGARDHGRRVRGHGRRHAAPGDRRHRRHRAGRARRTRSTSSTSSSPRATSSR